MSDGAPIAIVGAGPAGLIAAETLSAAGRRVIVFERLPSVARKFLMAGRGGLNLTHSEPLDRLIARYGDAAAHLRPIVEAFAPADLVAWAEGLGQQTFIGSSGRIFPKAMKASPLLRAWLQRLAAQGVEIRTRMRWTGWDDSGALRFARDDGGGETLRPAATLLALGGASWPRLGSDGAWSDLLATRGVALAPFQPANVGFNVVWSEHFRSRFAGKPLKAIAMRHGARTLRGEAMITSYGIEGGAIYALSPELRAAAPATVLIDLRPDLGLGAIAAKLAKAKRSDSLASTLRKSLHLSPIAVALLHEHGPPPREPQELAALIKAAPIALTAPHGMARAISTAGGVCWESVRDTLELKALPGVFVAGEMLDWEAPTGGYLLQACFATGAHAARAMLRRGG